LALQDEIWWPVSADPMMLVLADCFMFVLSDLHIINDSVKFEVVQPWLSR
jgi:hypothetical protein